MADKAEKELETRYSAINNLKDRAPYQNDEKDILVLTDLFVEKDIKALEKRAKRLIWAAYGFSIVVLFSFLLAIVVAFFQLLNIPINCCGISQQLMTVNDIKNMYNIDENSHQIVISWVVLIPSFIKSFTFYGLVILLGASAWKHAKANFDQAERLLSKRRTNRLLRLYIHLKKSDITLKDIKGLLALADTKNAFTDIKAEAKAPWGNVISDLIKANTEIVKNVSKNVKEKTDDPRL